MSYLIEVDHLQKRFEGFALQDVSFTLEPGYVMGFVGPNGAGKSTTIKLLLGLLHKEGGDIRLMGLDSVKDEMAVKQQVGFVLDQTYFHETMKISEVEWLVSGFYHAWDSAAFQRYLAKFCLPADKRVKELSSGMKAKLSMAVALSHGARLLILDEPTSGLDPVVRDDILEELLAVVRDAERGVLFSTHITSDLDKIADYLTFIKEGKIILSTTRDDINADYAVVKGAKAALAGAMDYLVRYRETEFGFEALTDRAQALRKRCAEKLVLEKAKVEDIMLFYEKGVAAC